MTSIRCNTRSSTSRVVFPAIGALALAVMLGACSPDTGTAAPSTQIAPTQPMAVETPPPAYPEELACAGVSGQVGIILNIGADGMPKDVRVEDGSGHPELDKAAVDAVKGWKFQAGTSRGKPAETPLRVPITFTAPDIDSDRCDGVSAPLPD